MAGIHELVLPLGFVDIKVCPVDAGWPGLKPMICNEPRRWLLPRH